MRYIPRLASTLNYASSNLDERVRYMPTVVFEDKYSEWFDYLRRDEDLMRAFGFEFFADEESYRAFVDAHPFFWVEEYRLDDLEIETIGIGLGNRPVFVALMNEAYRLVSLPDAPDRDDDEAIEAFMAANKGKYEPYLPPRRECSFIRDIAPYGVSSNCLVDQRLFALLIRAGLSLEEVLRACTLLHTYPRTDKLGEYDLIPGVDWVHKRHRDIEGEALNDAYRYRLAHLTDRIEQGMDREGIIAMIEREGADNRTLMCLFALYRAVRRVWSDAIPRAGAVHPLSDAKEVLIEQRGLDDFCALSDDELAFCVAACENGVLVSDIHGILDVLDSYMETYEAGVPLEDLFA